MSNLRIAIRSLSLVTLITLVVFAVIYQPRLVAIIIAISVVVYGWSLWAEPRERDFPPPGPDAAGLMPPPWAAYPMLPQNITSMAWRQGSGEWCFGIFGDWWEGQPHEVRIRVAAAYPEPPGFAGFYEGWGVKFEPSSQASHG